MNRERDLWSLVDDFINGYSVVIVTYDNWEPDLHGTPPQFEVVDTYAEGLDRETADAVAIGKSYELMRDLAAKKWAVAMPQSVTA